MENRFIEFLISTIKFAVVSSSTTTATARELGSYGFRLGWVTHTSRSNSFSLVLLCFSTSSTSNCAPHSKTSARAREKCTVSGKLVGARFTSRAAAALTTFWLEIIFGMIYWWWLNDDEGLWLSESTSKQYFASGSRSLVFLAAIAHCFRHVVRGARVVH